MKIIISYSKTCAQCTGLHCTMWLLQHLIAVFQYLNGAYKKDEDNHFKRAYCNRTRGNSFKLIVGKI